MFSNINRQQRYIYGRWVWVELFQVDGIWVAPSLPVPVCACLRTSVPTNMQGPVVRQYNERCTHRAYTTHARAFRLRLLATGIRDVSSR